MCYKTQKHVNFIVQITVFKKKKNHGIENYYKSLQINYYRLYLFKFVKILFLFSMFLTFHWVLLPKLY